ncbi:cell wall-binding repeat-containing protein [Catenulispora sp. NF23]|uniref:Cell wall-binding repeat-containing protein n=1 Tax=Catenulispora pinistramenti TaxID=2705254 RepID=A0ABS5L6S0_9ACTN|nr:cell wall-binding repeat-containing protein [Catenulispora pinistramenti]MBS2534115.1 cell wall-binding repeat-containing protein [Catenulispora pinistramenti]MBS2553930.1 cell wall-binding repeat-containing protein [Catenulispora pinistramenti]
MPNAAQRRRAQAVMAGVFPVAIALVAASASASPAQADTQHHSTTNKILADAHPAWATAQADRGALPAAQQISTRVYLAGQDPAGLAAAARAAADPNSPDYQHFLTPAQIQARYGATPAQLAAVQKWLTGAGLKVSGVQSDWIDAVGDSAAVQRAFGTQIKDYQGTDGAVKYAASSAAVIPADVADLVTGVSGLSQASVRVHADSAKANAANAANQNCSPYWGATTSTAWPAGANPGPTALLPCSYTPKQLRDAYGVTKSGMTGKGSTIAIVDWYGSPTMQADANQFATAHGDKAFAPGQYSEVLDQSQWTNVQACGGTANVAGEEALDVEMTHGLAPDANIVYVGANSCTDPDLMAAEEKIVDQHLADVVSNSWGEIMHTTDGQDMDPSEIAAYDRIFQKGALEGIGFDFSTGDCGDDDPANAAGGGANCAPDSARKQTEWPVSSSWVTAVGGTTLATDAQGDYAWEATMGDHVGAAKQGDAAWGPVKGQKVPFSFYFGGGGGTSEDVAQPWYQSGAVPAALADNLPSGHGTTRPMRTLPDVAMNGALASSVDVGMTGMTTAGQYGEGGMGGTSVAAPEFSALQADAKQAAGHALGFANPALYALNGSSAFHDVTGQIPGQPKVLEGIHVSTADPTRGTLYQAGEDSSLTAAVGYDTATGLGSPADDYLSKVTTVAPLQPTAPNAPVVHRIAGADRYGTAINVSQKSFPKAGSASAVVLATGETFPDALSGVPLATEKGGPLLLTPSKAADPAVVAEIHRVLAPGGKVYVLGGVNAVSDKVVSALGLPAAQVTRVAGADRYGTSLAIANQLGNPTGNVVLATGADFADALTAGPFSAMYGGGSGTPAAILLTADRKLSPAVAGFVAGAHSVAAVGGQAVAAAAHLKNRDASAQFAGWDRYATASLVAGTFHNPQTVGVATGTRFADALTGAAMLASAHSPLLLTDPVRLPDGTATALHGFSQALAGGSVEVFGGPAAVSDGVEVQVARAVGGRVLR